MTEAEILGDPAASNWLKSTLCGALKRDPVDAANDAAVLAETLARRVDHFVRSKCASSRT